MPRKYLLTGDNPVDPATMPKGTVVYDFQGPDYGCSSDDTRFFGEEYRSVTLDQKSFCTCPIRLLEEIREQEACRRKTDTAVFVLTLNPTESSMSMRPAEMRNILSLPSLIEWLEKQPPDKQYKYGEGDHCMIPHYLRYRGLNHVKCNRTHFEHGDPPGAMVDFPKTFRYVANENMVDNMSWTYGDALKRAYRCRNQRRIPGTRDRSS
jgi:hypothetical protein